MVNEHYNKYKETIKKSYCRNYRKRVIWLNNYLGEGSCIHCGESETICLKFYPHDVEISNNRDKTDETNDDSRKGYNEINF